MNQKTSILKFGLTFYYILWYLPYILMFPF